EAADGLLDDLILQLVQLPVGDFAGPVGLVGLDQLGGPGDASDRLGGDGHGTSFTVGMRWPNSVPACARQSNDGVDPQQPAAARSVRYTWSRRSTPDRQIRPVNSDFGMVPM